MPCERAVGKVEDIDRRIAELTAMREALAIAQCAAQCAPTGCAFLDERAQPFDVHLILASTYSRSAGVLAQSPGSG